IINNKGLSTEPWCTPTFTSKSSLMLSLTLTAVFTSSYIDCITLTNHSSTFSFLRDHQRISLGTLSNAFSKSTKAIHSSFFLHRYLSCSCLTMNMASVVPLPLLKPNCIPSKHTLDLTFPSTTPPNILIAWSNSFIPPQEPHPKEPPPPLHTATIQPFLQSSGTLPSQTTPDLHCNILK